MRFDHIRYAALALCLAALACLAACTSYTSQNGVENLWRSEDCPLFEKGVSTQSEVVQALGPPSQIIDLNGKPVFYYLHEQRKGQGMILILINYTKEKVTYDRAIFFFDAEGVLEDYAFSRPSDAAGK